MWQGRDETANPSQKYDVELIKDAKRYTIPQIIIVILNVIAIPGVRTLDDTLNCTVSIAYQGCLVHVHATGLCCSHTLPVCQCRI